MNKLLVILLISLSCNAQDLQSVINGIETENRLRYSSTGQNGFSVSESEDFLKLKQYASEADLIQLTKHKNGKLKSLAFLVLASNRYNNLYNIILQHIKDTTTVKIQIGCVITETYTTDYFIKIVSEGNFVDANFPKITPEQKMAIDELLIADNKSNLTARTFAIFALKPTAENYHLIRELVQKEKNYAAIYNLATYQKNSDRKLIASFFDKKSTKYEAVRSTFIFHDDYFYSYLYKACKKLLKDYFVDEYGFALYFNALANYPNQETIIFFEKALADRDYNDYRNEKIAKYILLAITKYPNPKYDALKNKINAENTLLTKSQHATSRETLCDISKRQIMNRISLMFLLLITVCCISKKRPNLLLPPRSIEVNNLIDKEIYTVLKYNSTDSIFKNGVSTTLNQQELSNIQRILEDAVSNFDLTQKRKLDLNKYKRQYIAVINEAGEKEVWVNCFCQYNETWKRNIVEVLDGGKCYFNLKINLTTNRYYDFYVNGDA